MPSDASQLKRALTTWAAAVTDDAGHRVLPPVAAEAPRKTGQLGRSGRVEPVRLAGTRATTGVAFTVIQAATTDKGARPHVIRPRRPGGRLVFYWPKVGRTVSLPFVNHPGNAPMRWFRPALVKHWPRALRDAARSRPL